MQKRPFKQKILIVDDSEMNRAILADMLGNEFDIIEAADGVEGVAVLQQRYNEIALVLLDIVMPNMDGFEVLATMNRQHWIDDVPVIMISAENSPRAIERAYELGVTDYISRPFDALIVRRRAVNTIMLYAKQKRLVGLVADQIYEREKSTGLMVNILSHIVEFRNGESGLHVLHINTITDLLLKKLIQKTDKYHLSKSDVGLIVMASSLHDIGKIGIDDKILNKPGRFTPEEFEIMKAHSAIGASMLESLPFKENEPLIKAAYEICRWHHERYDGRGYPDGLKGEEIPISAQIVALADVYDALTSERVYKQAYSHEKSLQMIVNGESGCFNPLLLECLLEAAEDIRKELKLNSISHRANSELRGMAMDLLNREELSTSERTLQLLEQERIKYRFLALTEKEILFEYIPMPEMLMLREWGAKHLGLSETIVSPLSSKQLIGVIGRRDLIAIAKKLRAASPENPMLQYECTLNVNGQSRQYCIICHTLWIKGANAEMTGVIGRAVDLSGLNSSERERVYALSEKIGGGVI